MRLGGRLQAAIEVLGEIEAGKRPASDGAERMGCCSSLRRRGRSRGDR